MKSYSVSGSRLYVWPAILAVIAVAGIFLLLSGTFSLPPSEYIPLEQTGLELLAPLSPLVAWAASTWSFLPRIFMPLLALVALGVTRRLFKTSGNFLFAVALLSAAVTAWLAWAAWIVAWGGEIVAGGWPVFRSAFGDLLLYPVALLFHWSDRLFGWMTYPLPLFILAAAAILFLVKKRSRRGELIESLLLLYIAGLLLYFAIGFLSNSAIGPISALLLQLLPRSIAGVLFGLLFLGVGYLFLRRTGGVSAGKLIATVKGGKKPKAADAPETRSHPGAAHVTGKENPASAKPITLDLTPPTPVQSPLPEGEGRDSVKEVDSEEAQPEEARGYEERCREVFGMLGLELSFAETTIGPATYLISYDVPESHSLSELKKQEEEIEFRLSEERGRPMIPIPGKKRVGVLFPRSDREDLSLEGVLPILYEDRSLEQALPIYIGKTIVGEDFIVDLAATPHLLVAGSTGSGKSVFLHALVESLIRGPKNRFCRLVLVDPKRVEFGSYASVANLACPVVEEPAAVSALLEELIETMEERYTRLSEEGVKNIAELHAKEEDPQMPYLVAVLDEVADLFLFSEGKEIKTSVIKLAQKSRAVGIHLVLATQRPSADVVDGLIKANFPTRVAFRTSGQVDSRVILDRNGAEKLYGKGDGLFFSPASEHPVRFQGAYAEGGEE